MESKKVQERVQPDTQLRGMWKNGIQKSAGKVQPDTQLRGMWKNGIQKSAGKVQPDTQLRRVWVIKTQPDIYFIMWVPNC